MRLRPSVALVALAASVSSLTVAPVSAEARPRPIVASHRVAHAHHRRAVASRAVPYGYLDSVPEDPRYGYEEAPYDPNYHGPGAEVFAATKAQARDAGLLHELAPDAKVSATGIVVGGGL